MSQKIVQVYNLGRLEYNKCLKIQKYVLNQKILNLNSTKDSLILVEHDPVYTIGIRRGSYPASELEQLKIKTGAQIELTDRGGLITFHGPGQLVAYPILNLKNYKPSLKWYVSRLEQIIIDLCKTNFNLEAHRMCQTGYTGVWANGAKIAAIGIHCKQLVTYHGLALNCNVNLDWFKHIIPCGIQDKSVSSLTNLLNKDISIETAKPLFLDSFKHLFECDLEFKDHKEIREKII